MTESHRKPAGMPIAGALAILSIGSVLLVVLGLFPLATSLMTKLAENQAEDRLALEAANELERLSERLDKLERDARLLATRPTLDRLLREQSADELSGFLTRFLETAELEAIQVWQDGKLRAAVPAQSAPVPPTAPGYLAWRGKVCGQASEVLAEQLHSQVLVIGDLVDRADKGKDKGRAGITLRVGIGKPPTPGADLFHLRKVGEIGWILASMPQAEISRSVAPLRRTFAWVGLSACLVVALIGLWVGRRWVQPLQALDRAARRIGAGDLNTRVSAVKGRETGRLARTMEDMRDRLAVLTDTLRQREGEAKAILAGIVEGVISVDSQRRIVYLNQQAEVLLGTSASQVKGRFCGDVLRPSGPGARPCEDQCPIVHARSRGASRAVERLDLADGPRTVVVGSAPPHGATQVLVLRDETEQETASRARDAILAHISHEFRTPLSAQLASIELLRDGLEQMTTADVRAMLATAERSALRLVHLIDNLLESVRIETGLATPLDQEVELEVVLAEAIALVQPLLEQRHQRIERPEPPLPLVVGNDSQLIQVFVNLIANAHKYAPSGSLIRVEVLSEETRVVVRVEDEGPGIQPTLSHLLFDRFQRLSPEGKGMGLGLWIVKALVERHGGTIWVDRSETLGGARFSVALPLLETAL